LVFVVKDSHSNNNNNDDNNNKVTFNM